VEWFTRLLDHESAATYRSLVEKSLVGVYLIQDGRFAYCNPRLAEIFGYESNDEIIRHCTVADLVWAEDRELVLGNIQYRLQGNVETIQYGFRGQRSDGEMIEVEVLGSRVRYHGRPAVIGTLLDVTEQRRSQRRLKLMARALDSSAEGMVLLDAERNVVSVNRAFTTITGYIEEQVQGRTLEFLRSGRHHENFYQRIWTSLSGRDHWQGEVWCRRGNGEVFPALASVSVVRSGDDRASDHYVVVINDISSYRQIEEKLDFLSHYDPLTELPNRALFQERLSEALRRAKGGDRNVALLMLDLDSFKQVNESLGHAVGDQVLRGVASRLAGHITRDSMVAHVGGDEFMVMLENVSGLDEVSRAASKILELFHTPVKANGTTIYTGASIGISCFPQDGGDADTLLKQADAALYQAKHRGRNLYQFASSEMNARALELLTLAGALREALEGEQFTVHYQPIVSLADGTIVAMEALLRWDHPDLGRIAPDRFIPVAEQNGQIAAIGEWVLRTACRQAAAWRERGLPPLRLAVNVSLRQLHQPGFTEMVADILNESGFPAEQLKIEITESVMMHDTEHTASVLERLAGMGVKIAVDDFGVGYSSLSYLKTLPVDFVKIDRSFIDGLPDDGNDATITRAIIAMSESLGIRQVAEGIETEEQRAFLVRAGCDEGQGRLFSRPVPADGVEALFGSAPA